MNIQTIFRGMTDGYVVNIGNSENTSYLTTQFEWDSLNVDELQQSLHTLFEQHNCAGLIHYFTINKKYDSLSLLKEFFETVNSIPGWKRRIILMRLPHSDETFKYLTEHCYTFVSSENDFDYFIHTIWDVLI